MYQARVLIISSHPLFRDGIIRLLGDDAEVIAAAATWLEVEALGLERAPDVIVVDHERADLQETDLTPLLWPDADDLRVIYVTLAGDRMTVHQRRHVSGPNETDLLWAITGDRTVDQSSAHPNHPNGE
ncbi:MAG: response regulator transcription factor [Anaerolineae bacterium]|nr:response regulator transcription factor [Anaerolineae bacterium]MCB9131100.1 response regulator transcription factor [Anaerolineales bacterium]MCB0227865.1 response regulator transcription factor [Anaerolineae bacterium]MCB0233416.1 response regulator transcription factor [Anaerolineae bacterium]MCB0246216.1 response regulator transcription factor [Anaerolineae bacterium]